MAAQTKLPKDAQVIMSIIKDMGISEYEPRVINQLLEFTYRGKITQAIDLECIESILRFLDSLLTLKPKHGYVTCILEDARVYANHAKKKFIDLEDVKLAVQMTVDRTFTTPPPREILLEVARTKNNSPLPLVKPHCGLRLPPDRYCLSSCNYRLRSNKKPQNKQTVHHPVGGGNAGFMNTTVSSHLTHGTLNASGMKLPNKQPQSLSLMKRSGTLATVARTQTITIPKPVIKFSSGAATAQKTIVKPKIQVAVPTSGVSTAPTMKMDTNDINAGGGMKRKREDDEYEGILE